MTHRKRPKAHHVVAVPRVMRRQLDDPAGGPADRVQHTDLDVHPVDCAHPDRRVPGECGVVGADFDGGQRNSRGENAKANAGRGIFNMFFSGDFSVVVVGGRH